MNFTLFEDNNAHNKFINKIKGRAISFIKKEIDKIAMSKKMVKYKKDKIIVYDGRKFVIDEIINNTSFTKRELSGENLEKKKRIRNYKKNESLDKLLTNKNSKVMYLNHNKINLELNNS